MAAKRVGSVTLGLTLVVFGVMFLLSAFIKSLNYLEIIKFWPVIFISLGIEMLVHAFSKNAEKAKLDVPSCIMTCVLMLFSMCVCLGHQAICEAYGGKIIHAKKLMHGKTSIARLDRLGVLFKEMDAEIKVARYHSLEADPDTLPAELFVTAMADGEIMAVEHEKYPVYGLQFHPESILTPKGIDILRNVVESIRK